MFKLVDLMKVLEKQAPLSLSHKMIEKGHYDNSGVLINTHLDVQSLLFCLDLTEDAINFAKEKGCDTIVTHHPAIYSPIKEISVDSLTRPIALAVSEKLNVISMHLNLDIADGGIDECLSKGLGAKKAKIIEYVTQKQGYGRLFEVSEQSVQEFVDNIKSTFGSDKVIAYGNKRVQKVASFCGSGADSALSAVLCGEEVDTIVTSDIAHHLLKELIERGRNVVILPHYVSENYGFNEFFKVVEKSVSAKVKTFYFEDKRFM